MKSTFDKLLRERDAELSVRTRDLQRVERENIHLKETKRDLNEQLTKLHNTVLSFSSVSGSGSNVEGLTRFQALRH